MYPLGNVWTHCLRILNVSSMCPPGKCPLAPSAYWNPILSTIINSMHNLYLGLIKDHCRVIWGICTSSPSGDAELMPKAIHPRPPRQTMIHWIQQILGATDENSLREMLCKKNVPIPVLWYICYDNGLRCDGDQYKLAQRIASWVGVSPLRHCHSLNCVP